MRISPKQQKLFYDALVRKDPKYVGVFYAGVKTTGVFCHSICPARKPKFENCVFFKTPEQALLASYRPCKRCRPLSPPGEASALISKLVSAVEREPERRWCEHDIQNLDADPSTVRRQFKKRFGMTFVEYARARRLGHAMIDIRRGERVIAAQHSAGYESGSGFRNAFSRLMGAPPAANDARALVAAWLDTPLGPMIAIADEDKLHLLEFLDRRALESEIRRLKQTEKSTVIPGRTPPIDLLEKELKQYFDGTLHVFNTPLNLAGSAFQQSVWKALLDIPAGDTRSYSEIAKIIRNPAATRAVARANRMAIIVPCHRVIGADGALTGYGGGLARKEWLLTHEARIMQNKKVPS